MVTFKDVRNVCGGAGDPVQWLRALTLLPQDLGSLPSAQTVAHNCL